MKRIICAMAFALVFSSVQAAGTTADRHVARGTACETCHVANDTSAPVRKGACLACHGSYEKLAERTKKVDPNPHYNHLIDVGCLECHQGHKQSVNMCSSCHNIHYKVP